MLQYIAFRVLAFLAPRVPAVVAYWLCDRAGDLMYLFLPGRRATVHGNLSVVLKSAPERIEQTARATFREGVRYYYETFRAPALSDADLEQLIKMDGLERLHRALEGGKGLILLTAHFGSPALVVQLIAKRGFKITTVAEPVKPRKLFDLVNGARGSRGIQLLPLGPSSFRDLSAVLSRNEVAGIVGDRDLQGTGVPVSMFGVETMLPAGTAMLALRTGAPILPAFGMGRGDGTFHGFVGEPLSVTRTRNLREDIRLNTQKIADVLQNVISSDPSKWIVFEPIWQNTAVAVVEKEQ